MLSDVYYPTLDNTNVETMQYIVTDGASFTDLQSRDMTYSVSLTNPRALECEVTSTATSGKYRIQSEYVTDPDRNSLLVRVRFEALVGSTDDYRLYVRLDPTINGNGGGGTTNAGGDTGAVDGAGRDAAAVACDAKTTSNAVNRDYAQPVCSALTSSARVLEISNGFVGQASDGLVQLDHARGLTSTTAEASNGNLVQTLQVQLGGHGGHEADLDGGSDAAVDSDSARRGGPRTTTFSLALGFGAQASEAVSAARTSLDRGFERARRDYVEGWQAYDVGLTAPPGSLGDLQPDQWRRLVDQYYLALNVVKASEDKTFPGALVASLASPWGQAISASDPNNLFFGSYREVFARDVYEAWTGLLLAGDRQTARDIVLWLFDRQQQPDGSFPRNSLLNGKPAPDTFNTQLDECSYPVLMAWQLGMTDPVLYADHIRPAANFVMTHDPSFGPERWEEQGGFSPSTIAAEVAGLIAAADLADANDDAASAIVWRATADDWQRSVKGWTVTSTGPLANHPYFIRLSRTGDPNAAISYGLGNGHGQLDQRAVVDAGFLELVRLGLLSANDVDVLRSLPVVDATIKSVTATGPGWHRYNDDGYGDRASDGRPWAPSGQGDGHLWPLLAEERGEYSLLTDDRPTAVQLLQTMRDSSSGVGLIPEQVWELPDLPPSADPVQSSIGFRNGHPAGSAAPLTWASGTCARLLSDLVAGRLLEQPANTFQRYVLRAQGSTVLTVTSPTDNSPTPDGKLTVAGSTVPGNTIVIAATNIDATFKTTTTTATPDASGAFSVDLVVEGGTSVLMVAAQSSNGGTATARRTVVFDFTPGTVVLNVTDPSGDDNGPGNYAYPTAADFHAGAFDIQEFRVIDDSTTVTFKLKVRDLTPTFGSPLGAQLVDVYVHDPAAAAADRSTAASFPQRNYQIADGGAWNQLIEVQGFGQRYVDAHGTTLGTVNITANAISQVITFSVPAATLGHPTSGWRLTVVLTGQDGFSPDQARGFQSTPQPFQFGVCAASSTNAHCTANPASVPKAMDVLTPAGVSQSDELDYTLRQPVVIQPVDIP